MTLVSALPQFTTNGPPDFVLWTGDNARHDLDKIVHPRTAADIYQANQIVANLLTTMGVQLIPSIGNNDVYPHNQLCLGPNDPNLGNLSAIWRQFIPQSQLSTFEQFGTFLTYAGNNLAVVSLNSLAMFKKNTCASGCHTGEAGDLVLAWLHSVLKQLHQDGVGVIISGHVPPIGDYWHTKCIEKYSELASKYQSTIIGHLYAHTHQDNYGLLTDPTSNKPVGVVNLAPSGVSTYNPSIRQYSYNVNNGALLDYNQYYTNLTSDNQAHSLYWQKEYTWTQAYNYRSWSLNNWVDLDHRITTDSSVRQRYINYRYVSSGLTQFMCTPAEAELGACVLHIDKHSQHP